MGDAPMDGPEDPAAARAIMQIEALADQWIAETPGIREMTQTIGGFAPGPFKDRARSQVDALVRQTFVEAFYAGWCAHQDLAAARPTDPQRGDQP